MAQFTFRNFLPDSYLEQKSTRIVEAFSDRAGHVQGDMAIDGDVFHCSLHVEWSGTNLSSEGAHRFAAIALDKAELNLKRKIQALQQAQRVRSLTSATEEKMLSWG